MGNLTIIKTEQAAMVGQINYDLLDEIAGHYGSNDGMPGTRLNFKQGNYIAAIEGKDVTLSEEILDAMRWDAAQTMFCWRKFEEVLDDDDDVVTKDDGTARMRLVWGGQVYPFMGQALAAREDIGDLDEDDWELDDKGQPRDPWQKVVILFLTDEQGTLYRLELSGKTAVNSVGRLIRDFSQKARMNAGRDPILALGAQDLERSFVEERKVKGKTVKKKQKFEWIGPTFDIVDWADSETLALADESEAPAQKKAKGKTKPKQEIEEDDEDLEEDETEEEVEEAPKKTRKTKATRKAKPVEPEEDDEDEDDLDLDEDEDDDDDVPAAKGRRRR